MQQKKPADDPRPSFDLRSEDLSEILGTPPSWLVRYGTLTVLLVFGLLLLAGWMLKYPDVITARVVFTTEIPPVEIVAQSDGYIDTLFVRDGSQVTEQAPLLVLRNNADWSDVQRLEAQLLQMEQIKSGAEWAQLVPLPATIRVGELRDSYAAFLQQFELFRFGKSSRTAATNANVGTVKQQIAQLERSIKLDEASQKKAATQLTTARELLDRQKTLLDEGLISRMEYEREKNRYTDAERAYDTYTESVTRKRGDISSLQRSIGVVQFDEKADASTAEGRLRMSISNLRSALDLWKQRYLLVAPIAGEVSLSKFFAEQQYVKQGEPVLTVVSGDNTSQITGRCLLPIAGSGKVQKGQRVIIKLDNYPYYEFGTLSGSVVSKAPVPKDNAYPVSIQLAGTTTNFNRTIGFQQQLQGTAEIITAERRFIQRIVDQLFASSQ
jgi:multidrug resistance efflux pump